MRLSLIYHWNKFASTFELKIDDVSVGIASLNTVWRCGEDDKNKIALGLNQITEQCKPLEDQRLRIALTHYRIYSLKEVEFDEVRHKCAENLDLFFCGHTHKGDANFQAPYRNEVFLKSMLQELWRAIYMNNILIIKMLFRLLIVNQV